MQHSIPQWAGMGIRGRIPPTGAKAPAPVAWVRAAEAARFHGGGGMLVVKAADLVAIER